MTIPGGSGPLWPADFQGCIVIGQYINSDGTAVVGTVTFTMSPTQAFDSENNIIVVPKTFTVTLDISGSFSITLPATDDPDINPTNWTYAVSENFIGGRKYNISAPQNQTVQLVDVAPVPASRGEAIVRGPRGAAGGVQFVNGHTGDIVTLTYADVGADPSGAAAAAQIAAQAASVSAALLDVLLPIGSMQMWGGAVTPTSAAAIEWHICDGAAVSRTTYATLFSIVGTSFGVGNGSTTFNLPDMRGRQPFGVDATGTGAVGHQGGSANHTHEIVNTAGAEITFSGTGLRMNESAGGGSLPASWQPSRYFYMNPASAGGTGSSGDYDPTGVSSAASVAYAKVVGYTGQGNPLASEVVTVDPYLRVNFIMRIK